MSGIKQMLNLSIRAARILIGKSYYHQMQSCGKAFSPDKIAGYFNDMTGKAKWAGIVDSEGIPLNILADGRQVYFATTIVQKALGHWDRWLLHSDVKDKEEFLKLCSWLLRHQDESGGWPIWKDLGAPTCSSYSAMTQGQCISAFVRAWQLTRESKFAQGAFRALCLMLLPIEEGGTTFYDGKGVYLEEIPTQPRSGILNGWIFALFGIYDYWLGFRDYEAFKVFSQSLNTIKEHLPEYDAGYWSYYDIRGHIASFFYHDLHIHQLKALNMVNGGSIFQNFQDRWIAYRRSPRNRTLAFIVKVYQKLREPGGVVIIK